MAGYLKVVLEEIKDDGANFPHEIESAVSFPPLTMAPNATFSGLDPIAPATPRQSSRTIEIRNRTGVVHDYIPPKDERFYQEWYVRFFLGIFEVAMPTLQSIRLPTAPDAWLNGLVSEKLRDA